MERSRLTTLALQEAAAAPPLAAARQLERRPDILGVIQLGRILFVRPLQPLRRVAGAAEAAVHRRAGAVQPRQLLVAVAAAGSAAAVAVAAL